MKAFIKQLTNIGWLILVTVIIAGCSSYAATNQAYDSKKKYSTKKAQFEIDVDRGDNQKSLVVLALSGGGSRAAVLASNIMLELEKVFDDVNILEEVDAISSVSGGSLPAAYYVISQDPGAEDCEKCSGRYWDESTVNDLMGKNYVLKWFGNWFWPTNIARYWFTAYDRSDIMAQTFADNLYDQMPLGFDLTFENVNPDRPNLIINSTNGTTRKTKEKNFSDVFTFTSDDFIKHVNSDIYQYDISRAVMASASFPAVFNFMTLYDHRNSKTDRYLHVFDGGNADNLGLISAERIIEKNPDYDRIIVILVDAYTANQGISDETYDPRSFFSFFVDLNFLDSSNSLLANNRKNILDGFVSELNSKDRGKTLFYHVQFRDIKDAVLRNKLNTIATDFKIDDEGIEAIKKAAKSLIVEQNPCLQDIRRILLGGETEERQSVYCTWKSRGQSG